ncbi:hypothetical protein predicted by Glimmer/Critica [Neisseria meningitidis WUE 2594]|uniref:Uncharacterized protein n=3 Tax=Neisseria meningitidis TaxID=487 RepID=C6SK34_NEIME|nr:hypothetical protein predicted by Glimmer/Critica [Neisseria meningitidis alpha275]CBA09363.1 hypothetical protein predicted by Glimmer/Critica [Neisseria meningitidis alpha153]CBY91324.1 hypothetical protein predicted by Glimmer/Critica [Neisseria meningitidis WUE 2594]CCA44144.1 hypothetical protein NMALPHA522_0603 [Neisseria meningitidis alpha522]
MKPRRQMPSETLSDGIFVDGRLVAPIHVSRL